MRIKTILFAAALAALAAPVFSQSDNPAPVINQRKENQQDRIASGVGSGQLTAGETRNLEKREAGLNGEQKRMEKRDDGNLTAADKSRLTRQQNRLSESSTATSTTAGLQIPTPRAKSASASGTSRNASRKVSRADS